MSGEFVICINLVLPKPHRDSGARVIVHGEALINVDTMSYHQYKTVAMSAVMASNARLADSYECMLVEGVNSTADINLHDRDIANIGFIEEADCNVILSAGIDKGGVFVSW